MEERITIHEKARGETINVYIGEYRGTTYLHIREWYVDSKDQEEKPTKKGVALPVEKIEALRDAIDQLILSDKLDEKVTIHEKARGETINVYIGEYRGIKYLHIREWYLDSKDQEEKPTKKGIALPVEKIEPLKEAIDRLVPQSVKQ